MTPEEVRNYNNNFFKKNIWAVKIIKKPRGRNYYYLLIEMTIRIILIISMYVRLYLITAHN